MKQEVLIGQTDYSVFVKMRDDAGAPATALAHTDIDIAYARMETDNDATTTDVTPADLANLTAAHSDWGWEVVSATDHPGLYRLDIADAVFASGAWSAVVTISGTGLDPADLEFVLVPVAPINGVNTYSNTAGAITAAAIANAAIDAATYATDLDTYSAKVWMNDKNTATATDLYTVIWYKNGAAVLSGVTSPVIQVIKRADGTDLVASTALSEVGALGIWKKDETAGLMVPGVSYIIKVTATIDGGSRTDYWPQGRDVAA